MPYLPFDLPQPKPGQPIDHADIQRMSDAIAFLLNYASDTSSELAKSQKRRPQTPIFRLGTIRADGGGSEGSPLPDYADARYFIDISSAVLSINTHDAKYKDSSGNNVGGVSYTADLLDSNNSAEIPTSFPSIVTATNLGELPASDPDTIYKNGMGTHVIAKLTRVVVMGLPREGDPTQFDWVFYAAPPGVVWLYIVAPVLPYSEGPPVVGGGGWYDANVLTGHPTDKPDPTTNVTEPLTGEHVVETTDPYNPYTQEGDCLAQNISEAGYGDPPTHWVPVPCYVPAWPLAPASTTADGKRPVYRFAFPRPGCETLMITGIYGSYGSPGSAPGVGGFRYTANVVDGTPYKAPINANDIIPENGEAADTSLAVCFENASIADGLGAFRLPVGTIVVGYFTGGFSSDVPPVPIYRGDAAPNDTFVVTLSVDSGSNAADATSYASYIYTATDPVTGNVYAKGIDPSNNRPAGFLVGPATQGLYQIGVGLIWLNEFAAIATCPGTATPSSSGTVSPGWTGL